MEHRDEVEALRAEVSALRAELAEARTARDRERHLASGYRELFHGVPTAMVLTDGLGRFVDMNEAFVALLGYTLDDLRGRSSDEISHPDDLPVERPLVAALTRGARSFVEFEKRYRRKDGTWMWARLYTGVVRNEQGEIVASYGALKDAEEELSTTVTSVRAVEARNRALLDAVPDLLFVMSRDARFLDCKPARDVPLLVAPAQFLGRRLVDVFDTDWARRQADVIRDVAEDGEPRMDGYSVDTPDGSMHFEALYSRASTGEVVVAIRDITKRVQAEVERDRLAREVSAQVNELRLWKALADRAPDGISIVGLDGKLTYANAAFEDMIGRGPLVGTNVARLLATAEEARTIDTTLRSEGQYRGELVLLRGDRSQLSTHGVLFVMTNEDGTPASFGTIMRDRTEERRAEEERLLLREKLIEAQQKLIEELETPILPVAPGVLVMPLVGRVDSARAERLLGSLLEGTTAHGARVVILDITGVPVVDADVAEGLVRAARAVRLLGAETMLTGIGPLVARQLVAHAEEVSVLRPCSTLERAVAIAFGMSRRGSRPKAS
ncbi:PAS domain S-box protein [Polyangium jinanense]|uniref:PAS domain S-box protein n=1 Tax=Polyangium jinanense TaxID=2829994 RepID=A0A9X3X9A1_9BACT|nr:PAS domain S-box protein [Polyangium jinanense]MDC3955941.1 PAS domain S-box protein [Polyangium jinanense]MDC3985120.1 PAS domain S-box protein [Polyangium jinanense]